LPLGIDRGHIAGIETGSRNPSEPLIKLIHFIYCVNETWLKTGEGEMQANPEEFIARQIACLGQQAIIDAFLNIMKECSLGITLLQQLHRAGSNDPELSRMIKVLHDIWSADDDKLKAWASIQFDRAFPADVVEEAQKKQKDTGQASAG